MRKTSIVVLSALIAGSLILSISPALAKTTEVSVNTVAWFGQDQFSREEKDPLGNTYTVESPNPFCPTAPGSLGAIPGSCAEGRLPIEVRNGNYKPEEQNKISAVGFDLSLIPLGSKVSKFTAVFLEAKAGCYKKDGSQDPKPVEQCEETDPVNVEGHELQACFIEGFLAQGEGRPIKEAPRFTCSDSDPVAKRKEVKTKDGDTEHVWSFDLTAFAQRWVKELSATPSIMIVGHEPKKPGGPEDSWRVVLTGPKFKAGDIPGIETSISFVPGATPTFPEPTDSGFTDTGSTDFGSSTGSTDFGSTGSTDFGGSSGSTDFGDAGAGAGDDAAVEEEPAPAEEDDGLLEVAGAESDSAPPLPGYVWLAILAGIVGFSLVRSVVLESAAGIRPNGVLAQIQKLNAERSGAAAVAAGSTGSPFAALSAGLHSAKEKIGSFGSKLNLRKKG